VSGSYETVIGLEVHAQLRTRTKMFCGCSTAFGAAPNTQTCPVCQGNPGSLPVINQRAIEFGIRTALALGCTVNVQNRFARKHYFYPDMPKNYQISQYEEPLAEHGTLEVTAGGAPRVIGIQRLHLEEDVGKLVHEGELATARASHVDFNRAGVPLMEIVSKPDLRSPEEAGAYLRALRAIVVYLGVCDGNMEEGSLRCDANVSIRPRGSEQLGTKVEIKNLNSFRHVQHALAYEVKRRVQVEPQRALRRLAAGDRLDPRRNFLHALDVGGRLARFPEREIGDLVATRQVAHQVPRAQLSTLVERQQQIGLQPQNAHYAASPDDASVAPAACG